MSTTIAELCSGYGGLGLACDAVFGPGVRLWHAETDPNPDLVYKRRHPESSNIGDITVHDWAGLPVPDVLAMGVPCQTVSMGGPRTGDNDERWLWPYALAALRALRPRRLVFENVRGLVRFDEGRLWRGILHDMHRAGYRVRWTIIGACSVGACHHRHRVFAYGERADDPALPEHVRSITCGAPEIGGRVLLPSPRARDWKGPGGSPNIQGGRSLPSAVELLPTTQARDGVNGVPGPDAGQGRLDSGRRNLEDAVSLLPSPRATDAEKGGPNQRGSSGDVMLPAAVQPQRWGRYARAVALHARVFDAPAPDPTEAGQRGGRRLAPALSEWMMGLSAGELTGELDRRAALKAAGNGVMPQQAAAAIDVLQTSVSDLLF